MAVLTTKQYKSPFLLLLYKIYGDTLIRNEDGQDSPFQFVINRAKVMSEVTLTMEAWKSFGLLKLCELLEPFICGISSQALRREGSTTIENLKDK